MGFLARLASKSMAVMFMKPWGILCIRYFLRTNCFTGTMTHIVDTVVMGHTAKAVWRIIQLIVTALLVGPLSCLYIYKQIYIDMF